MTKHKPHFEKHHRIAVIGAGPAGIHMASLLKKQGYKNITVLERENRIGGKSYTRILNGSPYEMGTCYLHSGYRRIKDLVQEYGLREQISPIGKVVFSQESSPDSKPLKSGDYAAKVAHHNWTQRHSVWQGIPKWLFKLRILKEILDYKRIYREIFGTSQLPYALPLHLSPEALKKVDMPMLDFLKQNKLETLIGIIRIIQGSYGSLESIPAYYSLCFITPEFLLNCLKESIGLGQVVGMLPDGYETLWRTMVEQDNLSIKPSIKIHSINRHGSDHDIVISYTNGEGSRESETYDFLILAINLRTALNVLAEPTAMEIKLFKALKGYTLTSTLYESDPVPGYSTEGDDKAMAYFPDSLTSGNDNVWYADRNDQSIFAEAWNVDKNFNRQNRIAFQLSEQELSQEQINSCLFTQNQKASTQLEAEWVKQGVKNPEVIQQFSWPYFMHFPIWAIREGYTNELFSCQGHCKTWYIGASASFESANHVVNYNHALVDTYL